MKLKLPRLPKMPKFRMPRPRKKLDARVRSADRSMIEDYDADEPQTKLSSAFIVVLLLHVVAVGGIYAFNSIKATRRADEAGSPAAVSPLVKASAATPGAAEPEKASLSQQIAAVPVPASATSARRYAVKPGDTLTSIAKQFGATVSEIETANALKPATTLRIGQPLIIPAKGAAKSSTEVARLDGPPKRAEEPPPASGAPRNYTVKGGDRLLFIAKRFSVSPDELIAVNKIKDPAKLQIGQTLKIPAKKTN